jgi:hypothetical protein
MRLLRPNSRIVFTFAGDEDLPEAQRPKLIAKTLSVADVQEMESLHKGNSDSKIDQLVNAAMIGLVGWENVSNPETGNAIPFCRDEVKRWMTIEELSEVIEFLTGRLTADDRKKSESQPS